MSLSLRSLRVLCSVRTHACEAFVHACACFLHRRSVVHSYGAFHWVHRHSSFFLTRKNMSSGKACGGVAGDWSSCRLDRHHTRQYQRQAMPVMLATCGSAPVPHTGSLALVNQLWWQCWCCRRCCCCCCRRLLLLLLPPVCWLPAKWWAGRRQATAACLSLPRAAAAGPAASMGRTGRHTLLAGGPPQWNS